VRLWRSRGKPTSGIASPTPAGVAELRPVWRAFGQVAAGVEYDRRLGAVGVEAAVLEDREVGVTVPEELDLHLRFDEVFVICRTRLAGPRLRAVTCAEPPIRAPVPDCQLALENSAYRFRRGWRVRGNPRS